MLSTVSGLIPVGEDTRTDEPVMFYAENQTWDEATQKQLKDEYNVIFNGGIRAYMVIERKNCSPLIAVGHEDDGIIRFDRSYGQFTDCFSSFWIDSVVSCLGKVKEFMKQ